VGAFKARGATNAVLQLPADITGVVTHSSGNHGQAVAYAASIRELPAWVVMPRTAPALKMDAVRSYGAEVVLCDHAERESTAAEVMERTGAVLVHPFDNSAVIAGQGTVTLELIDQVPDLDVIVAPIGGGGLLSGAATVAGEHEPPIAVIGAEPFAVDDAYRSLRSGIRQPGVASPVTVADGLLTGIGAQAFAILMAHEVDVVRVTEAAILEAASFLLLRMKLVVEPSGAAPLAAIRTESHRFRDRRVGVVIAPRRDQNRIRSFSGPSCRRHHLGRQHRRLLARKSECAHIVPGNQSLIWNVLRVATASSMSMSGMFRADRPT
jgi:threonine dehydratase